MKQNQMKDNKRRKTVGNGAEERLKNFQTKSPYKFRQVFDSNQQGQKELAIGQIDNAKVSFEKALSIYPEYIPAQNYLAVVYGMLGNYKQALMLVKKVIKLDAQNVFALIQTALFLFRLQRVQEAESYAEKASAAYLKREGLDPYHDYDMLQKLVEVYSVIKKDKQLHQLYLARKALFSPVSVYRAALALSNEKQYNHAIEAFQAIKTDDMQLKEKSFILANCIDLLVEEDVPIPLIYPEDDHGFEQLMVLYQLFSGDEFQKQESIRYLQNTDKKWAIAVCKKLLVSKKLEDWVKKAVLAVIADFGEAEQPINIVLDGVEQQITLKPIEVSLSEEMTRIVTEAKEAINAGSVSEGIVQLKKVVEATPTYIPVYLYLADAYLKLNDHSAAKKMLDEAFLIAPLASVCYRLSKYYVSQENYKKAEEQLNLFDTRDLENHSDVYDAIRLKVEVSAYLHGQEEALNVFHSEKAKFQHIINDWLLIEQLTKPAAVEKNIHKDISETLDSYKKDELIAIIKSNNIRGYSKLNKAGLIELINKEIVEKGLWNM